MVRLEMRWRNVCVADSGKNSRSLCGENAAACMRRRSDKRGARSFLFQPASRPSTRCRIVLRLAAGTGFAAADAMTRSGEDCIEAIPVVRIGVV